MGLQRRTFNTGKYSTEHFYLCHYRPKSSGQHDRLSRSLLRFKDGYEPDVRAWLDCSVAELSKLFINSNATVIHALGHDEISSSETDTLGKLCGRLRDEVGLWDGRLALSKTHTTSKLSLLGMKARSAEIGECYRANKDQIHSKRILVIDDILTTGATMTAIIDAIHKVVPSASIKIFTLALCEHFSDLNASISLQGNNFSWTSYQGWLAAEEEGEYEESYDSLCRRISRDQF